MKNFHKKCEVSWIQIAGRYLDEMILNLSNWSEKLKTYPTDSWERVMNARKLKKKPTCVFKNLQLLKTDLCFQKKTDLCFQKSTTFEKSKKMTSKLFEFVEQFVVDTFMLK